MPDSQKPPMPPPHLSYRDAGVDIDAGDDFVDRIKPFAKKTLNSNVLAGIGGFGALYQLPSGYEEPVLVSGTDGVGTKLKLAFSWGIHHTVGQDLVAMSVNDILVQGAKPLYFLDYFACGQLDIHTAAQVVEGIALGCTLADCALIGGETAEMPGMYPAGEYDLAGFAVGIVEKKAIIDGSTIQAGDVILGLGSSGAHSNGYSLIRKVIGQAGSSVNNLTLDGLPFREAIMAPTKIYVKAIKDLQKNIKIKGLIHITGGGIKENVPRILPESLVAEIQIHSWPRSELFTWLQNSGNILESEMHRVFNCGLGMVIVVRQEDAAQAKAVLSAAGERVFEIGLIRPRKGNEHQADLL